MSSWTRFRFRSGQPLLPTPQHNQNLLPVARRAVGTKVRIDSQIVSEFRSKLRMAEDLISKLAFSLREIQGMRRKPKVVRNPRRAAKVVGHIGPLTGPGFDQGEGNSDLG